MIHYQSPTLSKFNNKILQITLKFPLKNQLIKNIKFIVFLSNSLPIKQYISTKPNKLKLNIFLPNFLQTTPNNNNIYSIYFKTTTTIFPSNLHKPNP